MGEYASLDQNGVEDSSQDQDSFIRENRQQGQVQADDVDDANQSQNQDDNDLSGEQTAVENGDQSQRAGIVRGQYQGQRQ